MDLREFNLYICTANSLLTLINKPINDAFKRTGQPAQLAELSQLQLQSIRPHFLGCWWLHPTRALMVPFVFSNSQEFQDEVAFSNLSSCSFSATSSTNFISLAPSNWSKCRRRTARAKCVIKMGSWDERPHRFPPMSTNNNQRWRIIIQVLIQLPYQYLQEKTRKGKAKNKKMKLEFNNLQ